MRQVIYSSKKMNSDFHQRARLGFICVLNTITYCVHDHSFINIKILKFI
jgi:hypothetical protein